MLLVAWLAQHACIQKMVRTLSLLILPTSPEKLSFFE